VDDLYERPSREEIAARLAAGELPDRRPRCPHCKHLLPLSLGHFWACVLPRLEAHHA
jgi:hypothetical protein